MTEIEVSQSEIRAYQWCLRHWYLGYYLGYSPDPETERPVGEAKLGTRVHLALELWYGHGVDPRRVIAHLYRVEQVAHPGMLDVARLDKEHDLALAMVEGYLDWVAETGIDEGLEVISVEDEIRLPSDVPGVTFRAKLDQRIRRTQDGARLFLDHKTVGSFDQSTVLLHLDPQMRFYAMLESIIAHRSGDGARGVDGGLWNMLRRSKRTARAKPPFYKREEVRFNKHEMRATWFKVNALVAKLRFTRGQLDAGGDHHTVVPSNPNRDCVWRCQFVRMCPLMDDGSDWRALLGSQYIQQDPYHYYESDAQRTLAALGPGDGSMAVEDE